VGGGGTSSVLPPRLLNRRLRHVTRQSARHGPLHLLRLQQSAYAVLYRALGPALARARLSAIGARRADLSGAMSATIDRLANDGWQAEATPEYGFVFIRRDGERRLLMITPGRSLRNQVAVVLAVQVGLNLHKYTRFSDYARMGRDARVYGCG
jgi:hypothetical protein